MACVLKCRYRSYGWYSHDDEEDDDDDDDDDDNNNNNNQVQTDRTIPNKKPDIIIHDNGKGTCMLIDVAISGDKKCD